jgi:hypothetical protein
MTGFVAFALLVELRLRVCGGGVRIILALLALEIHARVLPPSSGGLPPPSFGTKLAHASISVPSAVKCSCEINFFHSPSANTFPKNSRITASENSYSRFSPKLVAAHTASPIGSPTNQRYSKLHRYAEPTAARSGWKTKPAIGWRAEAALLECRASGVGVGRCKRLVH